MKIYRAPHVGGYWSETDSIKPREYIKDWTPGKKIALDGTIDKYGERHTLLGLEIGEDDVVSLLNKLISNYKSEIRKISKQLSIEKENNKMLMGAFHKIDALISFHSARAPSETELIESLRGIAEYYSLENDNKPPTPKWMKWRTL